MLEDIIPHEMSLDGLSFSLLINGMLHGGSWGSNVLVGSENCCDDTSVGFEVVGSCL